MTHSDHLIISNRLPISVHEVEGVWKSFPASGGLITALQATIARNRTTWIGSLESFPDSVLMDLPEMENCRFVPLFLTPMELEKFYCGFSNEIIWPLFHDLQSRCNFDPSYWEAYQGVNQKFADSALPHVQDHDRVWVHDYHLMMLGQKLREAGVRKTIAYFHHIPFPSPDIFAKLPWRSDLLHALLEYDLIGLQTQRDRQNFARCLRQFSNSDIRLRNHEEVTLVETRDRLVKIGAFPISIDFQKYDASARSEEVAQRAIAIRNDLRTDHCILSVDRLDYTKGVPERLRAYEILLRKHPELLQKITLMQVLVPSRVEIPKYQELKQEVECLVASINGQYTRPGWVPIHHVFGSLERDELLAHYRACDIALITPLRDGMNLVAKEFCSARVDCDGVLVLSEFAGAASQLKNGALLVNPNDWNAVADALYRATIMPQNEKLQRMRRLRRSIARENVHQWCESFWSHVPVDAPEKTPALPMLAVVS